MLSHCANSHCSQPFLNLGQGKLFLMEAALPEQLEEFAGLSSRRLRPESRHLQRFWLCQKCACLWTLAHDQNRGVVLLPLPSLSAPHDSAPEEEPQEIQ